MLGNLHLQVFLHATFRNLHSLGKLSCLLILYNPYFSHDLNFYPCNLSCLCLTCLPSVASSVEWRMGLALSRSLLLSESSSNSNKSCICLIMPLLHTLFSLDLMEKPSGTFGLQNRSPRSSEGPMLDFPWSTALPVFTEAQEHGRCSGCLSEGLFLYLKMEWKKGQKLGKILL